jgi:hypothetical protein
MDIFLTLLKANGLGCYKNIWIQGHGGKYIYIYHLSGSGRSIIQWLMPAKLSTSFSAGGRGTLIETYGALAYIQ